MKTKCQEGADRIADVASSLQYTVAGGDVIASLECCRALTEALPALVVELLAEGMPRYTNRRMADALGVSPRMLRGLRGEVSNGNA